LITIIFGRAAQFLLALAMMRVATTLLSPEEMGRVSLVMTSIAFYAMFLVNPVGMFINRRMHAWQASGIARRYLLCYVQYLLGVLVVAAISLLFFYKAGVANFGVSLGWLIFLVCGSLLFNTINQTAIPSLNLLGDSRSFVILSVMTIATSFVIATSLVWLASPSSHNWLLGQLLGQVAIGLLGAQILFKHLHQYENIRMPVMIQKKHIRVLFSFAWPVAIAAGLGWVQGQGYRYLIENRLGLTQLGLFVAGYGISAGMIAGFESILTTYFQPRLYRDVNIGHPEKMAQAWQLYAAAVTPSLLLTIALIIMLAPELTHIFLGINFQSASEYVIWGALAEAARVLMGIYSLIAHVFMKTRGLIMPNLVGAVLSIALAVLLIPEFGAAGAGMALVFSGFAAVATIHLILAQRVGGLPLRPLIFAMNSAAALWTITLVMRHWLSASGWISIIVMLGLVGIVYLVMQYLLLREHLADKR
jgi:O-antigen/teichoic acid export membrane protein